MNQTKKFIIYLCCAVGFIYLAAIPFATKGYGYMGYFDFFSEPSYWYWHDSDYYYDKSARQRSVSGTRSPGGGPGQGK